MSKRRPMCGLGTHHLHGKGVPIVEAKYVNFIRLCNRDFRSGWEICEKCVNEVKSTYKLKKQRALALRNATAEISSVNTSSQSVHSSDLDKENSKDANDSSSDSGVSNREDVFARLSTSIITQSQSQQQSQNANDDWAPSPNVTNGTRLPHVQPIIKKRTVEKPTGFNYLEYTKDLTGG